MEKQLLEEIRDLLKQLVELQGGTVKPFEGTNPPPDKDHPPHP